MNPEIIIFDEATSMLDPQGKAEINALIHEIHEQNHLTVLSITHDIEEVAGSDHVLVFDQGHKIMDGKPADILKRKKELIDLKLDIPYALKFVHALQDEGVDIDEVITMERLVDELCQLKSAS